MYGDGGGPSQNQRFHLPCALGCSIVHVVVVVVVISSNQQQLVIISSNSQQQYVLCFCGFLLVSGGFLVNPGGSDVRLFVPKPPEHRAVRERWLQELQGNIQVQKHVCFSLGKCRVLCKMCSFPQEKRHVQFWVHGLCRKTRGTRAQAHAQEGDELYVNVISIQ